MSYDHRTDSMHFDRMDGLRDGQWLRTGDYPVEMAGWFSTTRQLMSAGWELVVNMNHDHMQQEVFGKQRNTGLYVRFEPIDSRGFVDHVMRSIYEAQAGSQNHRYRQDRIRGQSLGLRAYDINSDFVIQSREAPSVRFEDVRRVSPYPDMVNIHTIKLSELCLFPTEEIKKEIILPEQEVGDLLDQILGMQSEAKTERAKKALAKGAQRSESKIILLRDAI